MLDQLLYLFSLPLAPFEEPLTDMFGLYGSIYVMAMLIPLWLGLLIWLAFEMWGNRRRQPKRHTAKKAIGVIYLLMGLLIMLPSWLKGPVSKNYRVSEKPELLAQFGEVRNLAPTAELIISRETVRHDFNTGTSIMPAEILLLNGDDRQSAFEWGGLSLYYLRISAPYNQIELRSGNLPYPDEETELTIGGQQCLVTSRYDRIQLNRKAGTPSDSFRFDDFELGSCWVRLPYLRVDDQQFALTDQTAAWDSADGGAQLTTDSEYWQAEKLILQAEGREIDSFYLTLNEQYQLQKVQLSICAFSEDFCYQTTCDEQNQCRDVVSLIKVGQCEYANTSDIEISDFRHGSAEWTFHPPHGYVPSESCRTQRQPLKFVLRPSAD